MLQHSIKKTKIYFRADGNVQIGLGHITRCMALAGILKEEFECIFIVQNPSDYIRNILDEFELVEFPETKEYLEEAKLIASKYVDVGNIIVLDGYNFTEAYQREIMNSKAKIVSLDAIADGHFLSHAVINYIPNIKASDYSCESYTRLFTGLEYAYPAIPFLKDVTTKRSFSKLEKVFISFGGSDRHNLTDTFLQACLKLNIEKVSVLLGSAYTYEESINKTIDNYKGDIEITKLKSITQNELMDVVRQHELAIIPGSGTAMEVLCIGIYLITGYYAKDQKKFSDYLHTIGVATSMGEFMDYDINSIEKYLFQSINSPDVEGTISNQIKNQEQMVGKLSKNKIKTIFKSL